jgi:DNA-binding IclR family transcriptional regulator
MTNAAKKAPGDSAATPLPRQLLKTLKRYPGATVALLARATGVSTSAVRRTVGKLIDAGLVERQGSGGRGGRQFSYRLKN